jgi:hypothetical protein
VFDYWALRFCYIKRDTMPSTDTDVTTVYQDCNASHIEKVKNTFRDLDGF